MKKVYRAIVEGNVVKVLDKIDFPEGTQALVTVSPVKKIAEKEILKRQKELLSKGFKMGKVLYSNREELHER
jgi:predicted DNA-binding antitoxin AbrB/MazE fold protein